MRGDIAVRMFACILFGVTVGWAVHTRHDAESVSTSNNDQKPKYMPLFPNTVLIWCLFILFLFSAIVSGFFHTAKQFISICFGIFIHISFYYAILSIFMPVVRKRISARACAALWIIPNYLYITQMGYMELSEPWLIIPISGRWMWFLIFLWLSGFAAVLLWGIIDHIRFRRTILQHAFRITDPDILVVWEKAVAEASFPDPQIPLVVSPSIQTPLSIGLFRRTTQIVLPVRNYTPSDLRLIFLHEIVHIGRGDSWSKFFLLFCNAMCWFNPLMWIAMHKSAEDLELSCDETVLLESDSEERTQYASLLLKTAGSGRGFTTCLSSAAEAMRYRLKNVVKPIHKSSGAILVGIAVFILCITSGYVTMSFGGVSAGEAIFQGMDSNDIQVTEIYIVNDPFHRKIACTDEAGFYHYLSGLNLQEIVGNYDFSETEEEYAVWLDVPNGSIVVYLSDHIIKVLPLVAEERDYSYYHIEEGIDWDYLDSIFISHPSLNITLKNPKGIAIADLTARVENIWEIDGKNRVQIYQTDLPDVLSSFSFTPQKAELFFSQSPITPYNVKISNWDYSSSYLLEQRQFLQDNTIDLPPYPAHFLITAAFGDNGSKQYEIEYRFDIGIINEIPQ